MCTIKIIHLNIYTMYIEDYSSDKTIECYFLIEMDELLYTNF